MCASEVRFVPGRYVEADHVNGRPHSFYVKSLRASGVNQAFLHTNEALVPSPKSGPGRFILRFRYDNVMIINVL